VRTPELDESLFFGRGNNKMGSVLLPDMGPIDINRPARQYHPIGYHAEFQMMQICTAKKRKYVPV
jgi:hypothetical protein